MTLLRSIHAWCGVFLGLVLAVIAVSGLISVVRGQIVRATLAEARAPAPAAQTYGPALARLEQAEPGRFNSVKFSPYGLGVHRLYLRGESAFMDAEGRVVQRWRTNGRPEEFALNLHNNLLAGATGARVASLSGVIGIAMVLSGLILWTPTRRSFSWSLWPRSAARRDLTASHRNTGLLLSALLLVQMATGAAMTFDGITAKLLGVRSEAPTLKPAAAVDGPADWPRILAAAQAVFPDAALRRAAAPTRGDGVYSISFQGPGDINPEGGSRVLVDSRGDVLGSVDLRRKPAAAKLVNALLGVHAGDYAPPFSHVLLGATGLGLAFLALLGVWSFLIGRLKPRGRKAR